MKDNEWELIEAGDLLDRIPAATEEAPNPRPQRFQVFKLDKGLVYAVRMLEQRTEDGTSFTVTETAVIEKADEKWKLVRMKSKVMATGGFIVKRADTGEEEYDRCPSAADKSMKEPQTLENK